MFDLPQLSEELSIGENLRSVAGGGTDVVLDTLGRDLLVFLTASVAVTPIAKKFNITPILGYLVLGAILGPHGADIFSNSEADIELGDFGILFLLFSEGLEVSRERLAALTQYLPLGLAQLSLTIGVLTFAFLSGGPEFLERFLPLDASLINIHNPIEALVAAIAGALSTSAFVFPVLKEREWEDEAAGQAATSILLLQDLAVAPLLVILPYISGTIPTDPGAIGLLTAKATLGFGSVLALGSVVLRRIFLLVAETRSTETFVALCLLVAAGMGSIAKSLGLTDTAGAFAAGVLLANTNYRAQIQADILPFKGILLGIFFMDAGSSFDIDLVLAEWPTVLTGAASLLFLKFLTLGLATRAPRWMEPNGLPAAQGFRLALMLAGGGEFAFVVLALAEKLGVLSGGVGGLFTAIVLITMACTPVLGELAAWASGPLLTLEPTRYPELESVGAERLGAGGDSEGYSEETTGGSAEVAHNAVVVCGLGDVGREVSQVLIEVHIAGGLPSLLASPADWAARTANADAAGGDAARDAARDAAGQPALASTSNGGSSRSDGGGGGSSSSSSSGSVASAESTGSPIVALSNKPSRVRQMEEQMGQLVEGIMHPVALFGDGSSPEVLLACGVTEPSALFVTYDEHTRCLDATMRLRAAFADAPIFCRARTRAESQELQRAGATDVVVEVDELPRSALALLLGVSRPSERPTPWSAGELMARPTLLKAAANVAGITEREASALLELYMQADADGSGLVTLDDVTAMLRKSNTGLVSDAELRQRLGIWRYQRAQDGAKRAEDDAKDEIDFIEFCRVLRADPVPMLP